MTLVSDSVIVDFTSFDQFYPTLSSIDEVAARLEADDTLEEAHAASATEGQSALSDTDVDTHFVAFVCVYLDLIH